MKISDAEWEVMRIVWNKEPRTAAEVIQELSEPQGWNHRTIRTMLGRLVEKGALDYQVAGHKYLYSAAIEQEACVRVRSESFLSKVFGGDTSALVAHFVEDADLSPDQIKTLRRLLSSKKRSK